MTIAVTQGGHAARDDANGQKTTRGQQVARPQASKGHNKTGRTTRPTRGVRNPVGSRHHHHTRRRRRHGRKCTDSQRGGSRKQPAKEKPRDQDPAGHARPRAAPKGGRSGGRDAESASSRSVTDRTDATRVWHGGRGRASLPASSPVLPACGCCLRSYSSPRRNAQASPSNHPLCPGVCASGILARLSEELFGSGCLTGLQSQWPPGAAVI